VEHVVRDLAAAGPHVFVVDDLFWNHPERSRELADALRRRGVRKRWMLVQSRCDLVARHADLLEAWRPLAEEIDIFFGLEAASDAGLSGLAKDATTSDTLEAARLARSLGYQVTGNFVVDPDWREEQFHELWDFVDRHGFHRAGYTLLTPLPGTALYEQERARGRLDGRPWSHYDMHHALWEPRLGSRRKRWSDWARQVRPAQVPYLTRVLWRTQRMMSPEAYLAEHARKVTPPSERTGPSSPPAPS
jgi:radical SAM superfamily enzyme YgiQ (UPF0313 family)